MCKSVSEGGQRCASHTRPRFLAASPGTREWDEAAAEYASTPSGRRVLLSELESGVRFDVAAVRSALTRGEQLRERTAAVREALGAARSQRAAGKGSSGVLDWTPPLGSAGLPVATPEGSFDRCKQTSAHYTAFLRAQGVHADWVQVAGYKPVALNAAEAWREVPQDQWGHYVTRVTHEGGRVEYVDWTARQFDPDAEYPVVGEDLSVWAEVYDVDVFDGASEERRTVLGRYLAAIR